MKEFLKLLEEKGVIERFVERHKMSMEATRNKNGVPDWTPGEFGIELAAKMALAFELEYDEEIIEPFMKLGHDMAMNAVAKELTKIVMEEK